VLNSFKRFGTERVTVRLRLENQVTSSASSFVITEERSIVRQLTRKCCRDLERIIASSHVEVFLWLASSYLSVGPRPGREG
jgi:hypothetical protein